MDPAQLLTPSEPVFFSLVFLVSCGGIVMCYVTILLEIKTELDTSVSGHDDSKPTLETSLDKRCPLLRLPIEVRLEIYAHLFRSTRLSHGAAEWAESGWVRVVPARNSLALLRTCRQISQEVGDTWLGQVLFNFECPKAMLDKLTALPKATLSKIRFMRVINKFMAGADWENSAAPNTKAMLKLLPGLRLDRLTLLTGQQRPLALLRNAAEDVVVGRDGWKELHLIMAPLDPIDHSLTCYCSPLQRDCNTRKWPEQMRARDGASSNPSVAVYLYTPPGHQRPAERTPLPYEEVFPTTDEVLFKNLKDGATFRGGEDKDMLFIVKRGAGVDYELKADPDHPEQSEPGWASNRWAEILETVREESDYELQVDCYEDVDEYIWQEDPYDPHDIHYATSEPSEFEFYTSPGESEDGYQTDPGPLEGGYFTNPEESEDGYHTD